MCISQGPVEDERNHSIRKGLHTEISVLQSIGRAEGQTLQAESPGMTFRVALQKWHTKRIPLPRQEIGGVWKLPL